MATTRVNVAVETKADMMLVINSKEVPLSANGKGAADVPLDEVSLMGWIVVGDPGTPYTITLTPASTKLGIKAKSGTNPVKSRISTQLFRGSGFMHFMVEPKET